VVVRATGGVQAKVYAFERTREGWRLAFGPLEATVGRSGFAPPGEKREGDGRTPTGTFSFGIAFGEAASLPIRMPYRQATENDFWIDDPASPDYNTWVTVAPQVGSYERLKRRDGQYRLGIAVEFNTHPVVKGKGSAIFFHVWRGPGVPTAGCVALAHASLAKLLAWLEPARHPVVVLGAASVL
jgi:L,D-peptidoglycan transpeptidase YkuD (ErfK/YbiS/YcfS/YnhG family)